MSEPLVDVVIACHDASRPIERAVASVLHDESARASARVTVVAHGLPAEPFEQRLADIPGSWRVAAFADGIRSPAGPYNHGLELASADYVTVMGSDDFLEPGAMGAWMAHVTRERPGAAVYRMREQDAPVLPNPLPRPGRTTRLDAAKDRLFYRTAPLALVARGEIERLGLRMVEGLRLGEDFEFGIRLWSKATRVDFLADAPAYVIGVDARERTTHAVLSIEESLEPITRLLDAGLPAELPPAHRKALAIKLVRISVAAAARTRARPSDWRGDDEVAALGSLLRRLLELAPGVLMPFSRQDRLVLDTLFATPTVSSIVAATTAAAAASRLDTVLTANPLHSFDRESTLRRYALYFLVRSRRTHPS